MSAIQWKRISRAEENTTSTLSPADALARYVRHLSDQAHNVDFLALYKNLEDEDPLHLQLKRILKQDMPVTPVMHPLVDIALAYEALRRISTHHS